MIHHIVSPLAVQLIVRAQKIAQRKCRLFQPPDILEAWRLNSNLPYLGRVSLDANARKFLLDSFRVFAERTIITAGTLLLFTAQFTHGRTLGSHMLTHEIEELGFSLVKPAVLPLYLVTNATNFSPAFFLEQEYRHQVEEAAQALVARVSVCVTGPPGSGKTTFAQDVVASLPGVPFFAIDMKRLPAYSVSTNPSIEVVLSSVRATVGYTGGMLLIDDLDKIPRMIASSNLSTLDPLWILTSSSVSRPLPLLVTTGSVHKLDILRSISKMIQIPTLSQKSVVRTAASVGLMSFPNAKEADTAMQKAHGVDLGHTMLDALTKEEVEGSSLENLFGTMTQRVRGQDESIQTIANAIRRAQMGLQTNPDGPILTAFLLGPTGTGKTHTAEVLAQATGRKLTKINMEQHAFGFTMSSLIGSPHGYVGYGEGGLLTNAVKDDPTSIILLDEIEKADEAVHQLFLGIFDRGTARDGQGNLASFKQTIILMTSNVGAKDLVEAQSGWGFGSGGEGIKSASKRALADKFSPEFINRVDEILVFNALSHQTLLEVAKLQLEEIATQMGRKSITLTWNDDVLEWLLTEVKKDYSTPNGRSLRRVTRGKVTNKVLAEFKPSDSEVTISLTVSNGKLHIGTTQT